MKLKYNSRACSVLYNVIKSNNIKGKVLIPSNICESVPATYLLLGIEPVFCDISEKDFLIDKDKAISIIQNEDINILHYNRTYGYVSDDAERFFMLLKSIFFELLIVDDRCLCFPELEAFETNADVVLYSTGLVKCVDIGWGGFAFINNDLQYNEFQLPFSHEDLYLFEQHVKECHKYHIPIQKSILLSNWLQLSTTTDDNSYFDIVRQRKNEFYEHTRVINEIYKELPGSLPMEYCYWRYQLIVENSRECIDALFNNGLYCNNHFMSLGNGYFSDVVTPVNDFLDRHVINLFNDFRYTVNQAQTTCKLLKQIAIPTKERTRG